MRVVKHSLIRTAVSESNSSFDDDFRAGSQAGQQPDERRSRERDAARGWREAASRDMNEDSAAASGYARPGVVIELDDKVVEMIVAPEPVARLSGGPDDMAVIRPVGRVFTPRVTRVDWARRQSGSGTPQPILAPP